MAGLDERKEISGLEVRKQIGNRCGVIRKRCFERVGNVVSESNGCGSQRFKQVPSCFIYRCLFVKVVPTTAHEPNTADQRGVEITVIAGKGAMGKWEVQFGPIHWMEPVLAIY